MKIIARIKSDFPQKFGIPRQSGIVSELKAKIVFEQDFRNEQMLRGLEGFSHLWVIWEFSENAGKPWTPMVRPPRLGGNKKMGVFATRSPVRPNPIGLSCVKIESIEKTETEGTVINICGADMLDGTPVYDIKPYLSYSDSIPDARCGFAEDGFDKSLTVDCSEEFLSIIPEDKRQTLLDILSCDPRPSYQSDSERIYSFEFAGFNIKFKAEENRLKVIKISEFQ